MYNLAHLYLYNETIENNITNSIELLVESCTKGFYPSRELLCIALIKKFGFDFDEMKNEEKFNRQVKLYNNSDFLYNHLRQIIPSKDIYTIDTNNGFEKNAKKINHLFYEGFGIEI